MSKYNYLGTSKEDTTYFKENWKSAQSRHKIDEVFLHDFAGGETLTALAAAKLIYNRMNSDANSANVQWTVSDNKVCAIVPESQSAYATGVAEHNQRSLNIEIAPSFTRGTETKWSSDKNKEAYYKAWLTACKLIADICLKYGLDETNVKQHRQVKSTACPYTMSVYFGSYEKALSETRAQVKKEIAKLKGEKMEEKYYFEFDKITWPQTVIGKGGAKAPGTGMLTCIKDTYLFNDFEAHSQRQKCPKIKDGKPVMFITCGQGKYNKKGYYMHKVIFDSCVVWVCYKKKI